MTRKQTNKNRAFTLLELLITLTLFSAIMGVVLNSFFQFMQQEDRVESILKLRQELRILESIIRKDLRSVVYLHQFVKKGQPNEDKRKSGIIGVNRTVDESEQDTIYMHVHRENSFQRGLPIRQDPKIHEVSYFVEEVENRDTLLLKRREEFYIDSDMTEGDEGESVTHILSDKLLSFDIKYFPHRVGEPEEEWDSNSIASGKDPLPSGFQVSLTLMDDKKELLKSTFQINLHPGMGALAVWSAK